MNIKQCELYKQDINQTNREATELIKIDIGKK